MNIRASRTGAVSAPTAGSNAERLAAPDVLRGFALLGIGIVNAPLFAGLDPTAVPDGASNTAAAFGIALLLQGKAFVLFSFLFGWSFGAASASAVRRGILFGPYYARRLFGLLIIGIVHALFVFEGDILVPYALLGVTLWPLRNAGTSLLLRLACASVPVAGASFALLGLTLANGIDGPTTEPGGTDPLVDAIRQRVAAWSSGFAFVVLYNGPLAFGSFCAGLAAARSDCFGRDPTMRARLRHAVPGLLVAATVSNLVYAVGAVGAFGNGAAALLAFASLAIAAPLLAALYALAIIELVGRRFRLAWLAAAGGMSATGYIAQGVLAGGLYGERGPALLDDATETAALAVGVGVGALVVTGSAVWSRRIGRGPVEALLRRIAGTPRVRSADDRVRAPPLR